MEDEEVVGVYVEGKMNRLEKDYGDCIVMGEVMWYYDGVGKVEEIKSYFEEGVGEYKMNGVSSGWMVVC